jgi:hypothetical protein
MPEHGSVELHVLRVAADVGDQEQGTAGLHGETLPGGSVDGERPEAARVAACPRPG